MRTAAQNLKPAVKHQTTPRGGGPGQFNQFNTINWYQQTWHTIEFSNNRRFQPPRPGLTHAGASLWSNFIQPNPPRVEEQIAPIGATRPAATAPPGHAPANTGEPEGFSGGVRRPGDPQRLYPLSSSRQLRKQYTPSATTQIEALPPPKPRPTAQNTPPHAPKHPTPPKTTP